MGLKSSPPEGSSPLGRSRCLHWNAGSMTLFNFMTKKHTLTLVLAVSFALLASLIMPLFAVVLGNLFNSFMLFGAKSISNQTLLEQVVTDCVRLAGVGIASWILNGSYFLLFIAFGESQAASARDRIFQGLLQKDIEWFEGQENGTAAFLSSLQAHIHDLQMATSQPLGLVLQCSFRIIASLALALYTSWDLSLITLGGIPIFSAIIASLSTKMKPSIEAQQSELHGASKIGSSAITSIGTVKCLNGQAFELRNFSFRINKAALHYLKHARINSLQIATVRLMMFGMFIQGFWYGSSLAASGKLSAGEVLRTFWACLIAAQSIEHGLPQSVVLEKGKVAAASLEKTLVQQRTSKADDEMKDASYPRYCEGDVEVRNVSFSYASQPERPALKSVSFFFPAGETTFVVGKSGSGKSTLGQLLTRLYLPTSGEIKIDGKSVQSLSINWIRNNITILEQKSILFNESIFINIAFGCREGDVIGKYDMQNSIDLAMLRSTIDNLPNGINTSVGSGGNCLSGGEKQRVDIARTRLRDTPILILDEPTSALDSANRIAVMKAIRRWRRGKTTIIITHNMSQIQDPDFVYVMEQGSVVQSGYRNELEKALGNEKYSIFGVKTLAREPDDDSDTCSEDTLMAESVHETELSPTKATQVLERSYMRKRETNIQWDVQPKWDPFQRRDNIDEGYHLGQSEIPMREFDTAHVSRRASVLNAIQDRRLSVTPFSHPIEQTSRRRSIKKKANQTTMGRISKQKHPTSILDIMKTIGPSLTTGQRFLLLVGFLCALGHASATPLFSYCMSQIFTTFYDKDANTMIWSLAVLGVAVGDATVSFFMYYLLELCGEAWVSFLRKKALRCVLDQPQQWFEEDINSPPKLVACLDQNGEDMRNLVGRFAGFVLVAATITVVAIVWSLVSCWKLTIVALACGPVIYAITRGFEGTSGLWERRCNEASRVAAEAFVEAFSEVRTMRTLTLESFFHKKYIKTASQCMAMGLRRAGYTGILFGLAESTIIFVSALIFYYGAVLVSSSEFTVKDITAVFSMLLFSIGYASTVLSWIPQIGSSRDMAAQLLRLAHLPEGVSHEHKGNLGVSKVAPVTIARLNFRYPSRPDAHVLRDISLTIPKDSCTAIIGRSGSGKSSIASLLLSLYEPPLAHGGLPAISLEGVDIRRLHIPTLRSLISIVPQQPTIFPGTIKENISYALGETSPLSTMRNVCGAAQAAGIDDFISSLPLGYLTTIGDGGVGLSGGQAQRLVIARALFRRPQILILDEATSSLDPTSAEVIRQTVKRLVAGRLGLTLIIITHAREMMEIADKVVVMEQGRIVEQRAGGECI